MVGWAYWTPDVLIFVHWLLSEHYEMFYELNKDAAETAYQPLFENIHSPQMRLSVFSVWTMYILLAIQPPVLLSFERLPSALTPSSAAPFTALQGAPFEPVPLPSQRDRNRKWPPSSGRMTTTDNDDHPIWHGADSKDIFYSPVASCWPQHSCAASKRGEQSLDWERGGGRLEMGVVMERCGYLAWQAKRGEGKKKNGTRSLSFSHKAQQASTAACQRGTAVNNVTHIIILAATQWVDMHQVA